MSGGRDVGRDMRDHAARVRDDDPALAADLLEWAGVIDRERRERFAAAGGLQGRFEEALKAVQVLGNVREIADGLSAAASIMYVVADLRDENEASWTVGRAATCTTHHHACACREAAHQAEVERLQRELEDMTCAANNADDIASASASASGVERGAP